MRRQVIVKIIELVNSSESVHYNDIAVELGVSSSTAQRYAVAFSKMFKDYVEYRRGFLIRKQLIGLEHLDPETRIEAQKRTIEALEHKLEYVEDYLTSMLENAIEDLTVDEIREKLEKLLNDLRKR